MSSQEPTLRVQINQIDHTLVPPGPLDNSSLPRVPVLRIYGASSTGQKACVHIHQVYPYFYVEYNGKMNPDSVNRYIARLTLSLDHAIALSLRRSPHSPTSKFVRAILLVKGVHFYGFHSSYSPFLKIVVIDPAFVTRAVTVLQFGNVMRTRFNVYESHLSFVLQFMCDFGLYGCGWIDLGEVWQRGQEDEERERELDHNDHNGTFLKFKLSPHFRQTRMPLEVDAAAHQILNRHQLVARDLHHKLTIPAPPLPSEPLVISVRELWEDERRRRLARGLSPSPEIPVDLSESSRGAGGEWVAEARWWDEVRKRIEKEGEGDVEAVANENGWEKEVMSTFESVQALWERERKRRQHRSRDPSEARVGQVQTGQLDDGGHEGGEESETQDEYVDGLWDQPNIGAHGVEVDVDEIMLSSQEMSRMVEIEIQEWAKLADENKAFENEDGDEDESYFDDEEDVLLSEDGPPDLQADIDSISRSHTSDRTKLKNTDDPFSDAYDKSPGKRLNSSQDESPRRKRHRASSVISNKSTTRGKSRMPQLSPKGLMMTPSKKPATVASTLPASHDLEEHQDRHREVFVAARDSPCPQDENVRMYSTNHQVLGGTISSDTSISANDLPTGTGAVQRHLNEPSRTRTAISHSMNEVSEVENPTPVRNNGNDHPSSDNTNTVLGQCVHRLNPSQKSSSDASSVTTPKSTALIAPTAVHSSSSFPTSMSTNANAYVYAISPPSISELVGSLDEFAIPNKIYREAYYSNESDALDKPREYAGLLYRLNGGEGLSTLDDWGGVQSLGDMGHAKLETNGKGTAVRQCMQTTSAGWEYADSPPSHREVKKWLTTDAGKRLLKTSKVPSQIEGPTQTNPFGLKNVPAAASTTRERQDMNAFALEIFAPNRCDLVPDPDMDEIAAVFWSFQGQNDGRALNVTCQTGIIVVESKQLNPSRLRDFLVEVVDTELELLNKIVDVVVDLDPDIVTGWEVQAASWGYLNARGRHYGFEISDLISRAPSRQLGGGVDQWGMRKTSSFATNGRHVLNLWRIMRAELTLSMYSFENVAFHILGKRVPRYSHSTLTEWYKSPVPNHNSRVLRYMSDRTLMLLEILVEAEVVTKTAEFARVFGVDFMSVIRRGSQFKVEAFMFRIGKPESLVFLSPSRQAVGKQNAAECMPLIMEPLSAFYNSPLVVLDFQSLYPSVMIAYNYCYSTCLGRITNFKGRNKFGVTELHQPPGLLDRLQNYINIAPNGIMYVKPEVRKGLLGRMLTELLETRVMVKQAMKSVKEDKVLRRVLDARQLGLKYIANVTYGYTGATFSGRMPAVEIADSIVQSGRETLEKAVRVIDSTKKWGAKVVYGDTDSLFIYLRGKTRAQAFRIGHDMADTITSLNPAPVKLKFEKVYLPCVLMAKKRYVGFKYENPDDQDPVFDAKGIETVRRDGVPAQQKMTENCLKILFRTQDLSQVKEYCCRSWQKILENRASVQDFIFAKEVKMGTYSDKGPPPPGVAVAARRLIEDPNDEIQYGDRTPYVIIRGAPNSRLVDRAVEPLELLDNSHMHLDAAYYISRVLIPPLERIFNLVGANVRAWYDEMPKTIKADRSDQITFSPKKTRKDAAPGRFRIDEHFQSSQCFVCGDVTPAGICDSCRVNPQTTIPELLRRISKGENRLMSTQRICESCTSSAPSELIKCESVDCAWLFERKKAERKAETIVVLQELVDNIEPGI